jgi:ABC-type Fe3+-citrate transport system substrate-binding protein
VYSREEWRTKAVKRTLENKELRKALAKHKQRIAGLKEQLKASRQIVNAPQKKK